MNVLEQFDGSIDQSGKTLLLDHHVGVGDCLWRSVLHRELKRRNSNMKLIVSSIGNYWKLMFKDSPYIDELRDKIGGNLDLRGVDWVISDQKCVHVISQFAREMDALDALEIWAGFEIRDKGFYYKVSESESKWADSFLSKYERPIIGIQLKSSTWVRTPKVSEIIRLIRMLRFNGYNVVVLDNGGFGFIDEGVINLASGYNIREIAAIIQKLDLLITPDSGLLHFGGHFKIPTIAIFGGSDPACRLKYYDTVYPIYAGKNGCKEWPCWIHAYACNFGIPAPCLEVITADMVFDKVKQILG